MSAANFRHNFQSYVERLGVQAPHGNEQDQAAVPASEGEGYIRRVIPRSDIELVVAKHALSRAAAFGANDSPDGKAEFLHVRRSCAAYQGQTA